MSIVDKLGCVHVGDIVRLSNSELSIAGYVLDYSTQTVTLGYENPLDQRRWWDSEKGKSGWRGPKGSKTFSGDRTYSLRNFDDYELLQPAKE